MLGYGYLFDDLYFSEPNFFLFFYPLLALSILFFVVLILKKIFQPPKTRYSRYYFLGKDIRWLLILIILAFSIIALAGPKKNKGMKMAQSGSTDIGFLVDFSASTKADDVVPDKSRLDIIKSSIVNLIAGGEIKSGDRLALFAFGETSVWRLPLSEDFEDFKSKLKELSHPPVYQEDSQLNTNLSNVIEHVPKSFDKQDNFFERNSMQTGVGWFKNNRIVFIFSDGDDNEGRDLSIGIREFNKRKIKIFSVGIGTEKGKNIIIESYDPDNADKTLKTTIKTSLKMRSLEELALKTGGSSYVIKSSADIQGVQNFMKKAISSNRDFSPRLVASVESHDIWWEVLAWPSIILLLFVLINV